MSILNRSYLYLQYVQQYIAPIFEYGNDKTILRLISNRDIWGIFVRYLKWLKIKQNKLLLHKIRNNDADLEVHIRPLNILQRQKLSSPELIMMENEMFVS